MTEKVRIKSLAERCRVTVIEVREGGVEGENEDDEDEDDDEDMYGGGLGDEYSETPGRWEMEAARVYEKTIQVLGDEMGNQGPL